MIPTGIFLIFLNIDHFLSPSVPHAIVVIGLILELTILPFVKKSMKSPLKYIIEFLDQHKPSFTFYPILSFLLLTSFTFHRTFFMSSFITLILSTLLIFFSYYLIATSISGARLHQEHERISMTDSLTGLYNRRYMEKQIQQEFDRYKKWL
ncbi:diguanylate cyclase [Oceanispirochaeta crateris]|uniref:Diguanylate cyclase n=1 Tax=Oceanispirochaeta crateris TaxID=2518645 RepID=A0A5C1QIK9_9SPIO|nr:diguanylate cyclase [Oceanispirochaeta crateris]